MATQAHCAYCFETLTASFERREPLSLQEVQELWHDYVNAEARTEEADQEDDAEMTDAEADKGHNARPAAISRLLNRVSPSSTSSSTSLPSIKSSASASTTYPASSVSSSRTSLSASVKQESHPLFVTWNTLSKSGCASMRGCIGTFEALELSEGLRSYALTSAFEDHRFSPIPASLLPSLQVCVTLLTNFSAPTRDPMDWTLGTHGIRIRFTHRNRRYGATYLPDIPPEHGWTKEETIVNLMRKAGWSGPKGEWRKVQGLEVIRYEGKRVDMDYKEFLEFKSWTEK